MCIMGFAKAEFKLTRDRESIEGLALADSGAWYTVIDRGLAEKVGVRYTGLNRAKDNFNSFSGHRIDCQEAVLNSITLEGKAAPSELVAICSIPDPVRELLRRQ
ncbi:hypothetical protein KEJ49_05590 [Candidatus Bathyarchaeota archaeon]|nr:hypothetical protein [Candidatus Bathyarchaeota archaeon]